MQKGAGGEWTVQRVSILASIVLVLVVGGRWAVTTMFSSAETNAAQERVREVLEGLKSGGDLQSATAMWYRGTRQVPGGLEAFGRAQEEFIAWQRQASIDRIASYEIGTAELLAERGRLGEAKVIVSCTIDGTPHKLHVQTSQAIAWAD
jgi:hypothetical protein